MKSNTKKILLTASISLLIILLIGGYFTFIKLKEVFKVNTFSELAKAASQFDDISIEELSEYNPATQKAFDALNYKVQIELLTKQEAIEGDVTILLKVNDKKSKTIPLNFYDNLDIKSLDINGTKGVYKRDEKIITINRPDINSDSASIRIVYKGKPQSYGFGSFNFSKHNNKPFVYTMNEPVYASTWMPCMDVPDDKAFADIYITNDSSNVSLSNGKLIDVKTNGAKKTYHWKTIYPISTYLIAIYSGQYKTFEQKYYSTSKDTVNLSYFVFAEDFEEAQKDFSDHPKYFKIFEELFGAYPFSKEKYSVAQFLWQGGAMEHQTLTGIGTNFISGRKLFSDMLIHELAHHWWGNSVGPKTWNDIWLNEGFATYSEALYWEKATDISALKSTMHAKTFTFNDGVLYNPGKDLFSLLVYDKGAWVLHMLRKEIGDKNFFASLNKYYNTYKYSNASTADFKRICENVSGKKLKFFFDQWVYKGDGRIEGEYDWSVENDPSSFNVKINIEQLQNGYDIYKFPLDIKIIYSESDFEVKTVSITNKKQTILLPIKMKPKKIVLDPDGWLLANFVINE